MPSRQSMKIFRGDTAVDIEVQRRAVEVEFASEQEEKEYQEIDWTLHEQVQRVLRDSLTVKAATTLVHVNEDWWPNRTKSVELDASALSPALVSSLQSLLVGPYATWSLGVEVYQGFGQSEVAESMGPIRIYANEVLTIERLAAIIASDA